MNDFGKTTEGSEEGGTMHRLLGQLQAHEGHINMQVRHADVRITNLDERDPRESTKRPALLSALHLAKSILALVQMQKPRVQTRPPQSRGGRGR